MNDIDDTKAPLMEHLIELRGRLLKSLAVLAVLSVSYIILGMFLEGFAMMVLTIPIVFPIVTALGIDTASHEGALQADDTEAMIGALDSSTACSIDVCMELNANPFANALPGSDTVGTNPFMGVFRTADGGSIVQWTDNNAANQQFSIQDIDGYIQLINRNSGKAVEVQGASTADGANIVQYSDWNGANQQWQLVRLGTGADTVDGGADSDTLVVRGDFAGYAFTRPNGTQFNLTNAGDVANGRCGFNSPLLPLAPMRPPPAVCTNPCTDDAEPATCPSGSIAIALKLDPIQPNWNMAKAKRNASYMSDQRAIRLLQGADSALRPRAVPATARRRVVVVGRAGLERGVLEGFPLQNAALGVEGEDVGRGVVDAGLVVA